MDCKLCSKSVIYLYVCLNYTADHVYCENLFRKISNFNLENKLFTVLQFKNLFLRKKNI